MFEVPPKCFHGKTALVFYLTEELAKILFLKVSTQMFDFFLSPS